MPYRTWYLEMISKLPLHLQDYTYGHARLPNFLRRRSLVVTLTLLVVFLYYALSSIPSDGSLASFGSGSDFASVKNSPWARRQQHFPVKSFQQLPRGRPQDLPKIQYETFRESSAERGVRESRLAAVRESFAHAWEGYRKHAWLKDELMPLSGKFHDSFGHWAATLVDSLDSLWILGLREEFDEAVTAVANIDFSTSTADTISVFETTIRYLGGLLSAYDLSGRKILLEKALQLGEMLYTAFDTPNRMPVPYWDWKNARDDGPQETSPRAVSADIGSLTMEFTRLSQISGDPKFFDAIQRISDTFATHQHNTSLPGLWPVFVNAVTKDFSTGDSYSLGALADSLYEYLPKMHILLGGLSPSYGAMYLSFIEAAKKHMFFRPLNPSNLPLLIPGSALGINNHAILDASAQHLGCFVGGMVGIGARTFSRPEDLETAAQLANGCVWAYDSMPSGIMPEIIQAAPCPREGNPNCTWSEQAWHDAVLARALNPPNTTAEEVIADQKLPPGITQISNGKYILRPEAIESVFIMYRITGDREWQEKAWRMFQAIEKATRTQFAHAALENVAVEKPEQVDSMESFWTAETLKYFYLIFAEESVISLDDWVFNTEAHPFRRPKAAKGWFAR